MYSLLKINICTILTGWGGRASTIPEDQHVYSGPEPLTGGQDPDVTDALPRKCFSSSICHITCQEYSTLIYTEKNFVHVTHIWLYFLLRTCWKSRNISWELRFYCFVHNTFQLNLILMKFCSHCMFSLVILKQGKK